MRPAVDALLWMLDSAFEGGNHSLMANLKDVRDQDWLATPPEGRRSIASILEQVGWANWMYENYGFGDGSLKGAESPMTPRDGRARPRLELLGWLGEGHLRLRARIDALPEDAELDRPRFHYGRQTGRPTREIIRVMISHDFYHAGEINHVRALLQGNDAWPHGGP